MFIPNNTALIYRRSDTADRRGEYTYAKPVRVPCAVVDLNLEVQKTSVRADSSGSRGKAREETGGGRVLFPRYIKVREGDIIEVDDEVLEATSIFPRRNVLGVIDHIDVQGIKSHLP